VPRAGEQDAANGDTIAGFQTEPAAQQKSPEGDPRRPSGLSTVEKWHAHFRALVIAILRRLMA